MKITILGKGNAGVLSALHFSKYTQNLKNPPKIELIHDKEISPVPVGQATNLTVTKLLWDCLGTSYINEQDFSFTEKTGIMYENWGKKNKKIWHPFPVGNFAFHFNPSEFQNYVINQLDKVKVIEKNIPDYDKIDTDFIIDCRGTPKDLSNYHNLINPLNHVLLAKLPPKKDYVKWTRTIATPDGWCFYIPLKDRISLGYNFNSGITSIEKAKENFKKYLDVDEIHNDFSYKQYLAKNPIIDNRVFLNGNRLFFLEPLEATAVASYVEWNRKIFDCVINKYKTQDQIIKEFKTYINQIQNFILYHYKNGSIYNTKFWKYAKKLCNNNEDTSLNNIVEYVNKNNFDMLRNEVDFEKHSHFYGQWKKWNIKLWTSSI
jgi:hypothetical protein